MEEKRNAADLQPWTARQKTAVVLDVLRNRVPAEQACERHGIPLHDLARWMFRFIEGGQSALGRPDREGLPH